MHRFFVSPDAIHSGRVLLRGTIVHQIRDVLRMHPGDEIILLNNIGSAFRTELVMVERDMVRGRVLEEWKPETEPQTKVTLYQGLLKGQKFDWVLQKGTELGVSAFVPMLSARCIMGSVEDVSETRLERWQRIIAEAAEQAGRATLPRLASPMVFRDACESAAGGGLSLIPWENEKTTNLREALELSDRHEVGLLIGPEGGFAEEEIAAARQIGVVPVSLGPRILRAETAGLVATTAVLFARGDMA